MRIAKESAARQAVLSAARRFDQGLSFVTDIDFDAFKVPVGGRRESKETHFSSDDSDPPILRSQYLFEVMEPRELLVAQDIPAPISTPASGSPPDAPPRPGKAPFDSLGGGLLSFGGEGVTAPELIPPTVREVEQFNPAEVVIDGNGLPRQAGATTPEGEWIRRYKRCAEQDLFVFLKGILGRFFLTPHFHREVCRFIQQRNFFRKLVLMPREHAKTTIVAGGLPPHILIQPAETNIYFPGLAGSECRILLAGETETMAKKNLRVVTSVFEENKLFRALWPERVWQGGKGKVWSSESIIIPRKNEWPDPSIRAIGVGGAVTGARPNVMIKDDLVSFKAANSDVVMDEAIEWHKASRALLDKYEVESGLHSLEYIIGTRWSVYDLYSYIIDNDPSVEVIDDRFHKIIRDGKLLWPEKYTMSDIEQLRTEHGKNFYLLYLNSAADPALTDFDMEQIRDFRIVNGCIEFEEDERDRRLEGRRERQQARAGGMIPAPKVTRGQKFNAELMKRIAESGGGRIRA